MGDNLNEEVIGRRSSTTRRKSIPMKGWTEQDLAAYAYLVRAQEAREWIQNMLEREISEDLSEELKDGKILCELVEKIDPTLTANKSVNRRYSLTHASWKERENISIFLRACKKLGVQQDCLFDTDDLYEKHNMLQVYSALHHMSRMGTEKGLIHIDASWRELRRDSTQTFSTEQMNIARAALSAMEDNKANTAGNAPVGSADGGDAFASARALFGGSSQTNTGANNGGGGGERRGSRNGSVTSPGGIVASGNDGDGEGVAEARVGSEDGTDGSQAAGGVLPRKSLSQTTDGNQEGGTAAAPETAKSVEQTNGNQGSGDIQQAKGNQGGGDAAVPVPAKSGAQQADGNQAGSDSREVNVNQGGGDLVELASAQAVEVQQAKEDQEEGGDSAPRLSSKSDKSGGGVEAGEVLPMNEILGKDGVDPPSCAKLNKKRGSAAPANIEGGGLEDVDDGIGGREKCCGDDFCVIS